MEKTGAIDAKKSGHLCGTPAIAHLQNLDGASSIATFHLRLRLRRISVVLESLTQGQLRLPGEGTTNEVIDEVAAVTVDLQAISIKAANADAAARSIRLRATETVPIQHPRLPVYKIIQQRCRHKLYRLYLSILWVVSLVYTLLCRDVLTPETLAFWNLIRVRIALWNQHPLAFNLLLGCPRLLLP